MSWVLIPQGSHFPITNLPFGVFSSPGRDQRIGVAIGEQILDVRAADEAGLLPDLSGALRLDTLDGFLAAGRVYWRGVRSRIAQLLSEPAHEPVVSGMLVAQEDATMHLPFTVADFVDFYASEQHATNLGKMFRPDSAALLPNWKHLPVGYHGRAGTVVVSGTDVRRPQGQRKAPDASEPTFGPSARLDFEAEVGFVVGTGAPGPVSTADFAEHVFGVCLVNDWSARDIQAWEYVPLGPFLGKSFATSISPWIVSLDALIDARTDGPAQDPTPLPYLRSDRRWSLDLALEVTLNGETISRPPFASVYWSADQQLAHMTVNGASLRTGDLFASGTVSGDSPEQRGSLIELSWGGKEPITLTDGSSRSFLLDGDTLTISATAPGVDGTRIGFGSVSGTIQPSI
ncbi:fumarylacetoacetase [Stackebrandtia soli]|uniref:fumarylacetoacetase n=1 Tax=Stackebrandtia soli TaxID=1892856 RepID=UPI0039E7300B